MRNILSILLLLLIYLHSYSQTKDTISNPLEKFFQENYDSTIIYHAYSSWGNYPDLYIIGKKDDTVYYYHYYKPFNQPLRTTKVGPYKSRLFNKLIVRNEENRSLNYINSKIDIDNSFFWVLTEVSKGSLWEKIQSENIWNFLDDNSDELKKNIWEVMDGSICEFKLITKDKVIKLKYFNPEVYPKNSINRIRNRVSEITKQIMDFYTNHVVKFDPYLW